MTANMRTKITFEPNITQVVRLEFKDGKEVPGRHGPQYLYWLDNNRSMFVDQDLHEAIQRMQPQVGDELEITKRTRGNPKWEVIMSGEEPAHDEPAAPPPPRSTPTRPDPQPAFKRPDPQPTQTVSKSAADLVSAFIAAIDALQEAQAYAKRKGLDFRFDTSDIRATAISTYISQCKGGAR